MKSGDSLILFYHRIAEGVDDPFNLCVTPARFAAHLDEIGRYGEPSTLAELSLPSPRPRIVVTFDDGYADNLINAVPIVEAKGVPITIFVTSGVLGSHGGFWWDRLGTLLRSRPSAISEITLPAGERTVRIGLGSSCKRKDLQSVRRHLLPLPVTEIHRVLDAVSEQWGISAAPPPDARPLTVSEFVQLAASNMVTIGDHTVDHVRLRGLHAADQKQTIVSSKEQLERLSGQADLTLRLPLRGQGCLRRPLGRRCALGWFRNGMHHHPGQRQLHVGPAPPPAPNGQELESTSFQGGPGALETGPPSLISEPLCKEQ